MNYTTQSKTMPEVKCVSVDVVVAGSGIGGLIAALSVQELGAEVLVLEKAPEIGGSAAASGGLIWCVADMETWMRVQPGGDPAMARALLENFSEGIDWLHNQGFELLDQSRQLEYKFPWHAYLLQPDASTVMGLLAERIQGGGGHIFLGTGLRNLIQDSRSRICGLIAHGPEGFLEVRSGAVVLATGGFQANHDLRARYFGRWADRVVVRGTPYSTGDGFLAALDIGAGTSGPFSRFYGHMIPADPAETGLHNYLHVKPDFSEYAVFVNLEGNRFEDEFLGDEVTVQSAIHQPEAFVFLIFDEEIRRNRAVLTADFEVHDNRLNYFREAGAEIIESGTLEGLAKEMASRWKVQGGQLLNTLWNYNTACKSGDTSLLSIPKSGGLDSITTPPFYGIRMVPGATFTYGGVRVSPRAEVLDTKGLPILGLYAAGADVGGIYTRGYTGGLSLGLAYGRIAGKEAASLVLEEDLEQ